MQRCHFKILLSFRATLSFFVARGKLEKRCTTFIIRRQFKKSPDPLNALLSPYFSVILHSFVFNWPCTLKLLAIPVTLVRGRAVYPRSEPGQITIFQFPGRVPGSCLAQIPFGDLINRTLLRHAYYAVFPLRYAYFLWHLPAFSGMRCFSATSCFSLVSSMTVGHDARGNERKNCYELMNEVSWNRPFVREIRTHCRFERQIRAVE